MHKLDEWILQNIPSLDSLPNELTKLSPTPSELDKNSLSLLWIIETFPVLDINVIHSLSLSKFKKLLLQVNPGFSPNMHHKTPTN